MMMWIIMYAIGACMTMAWIVASHVRNRRWPEWRDVAWMMCVSAVWPLAWTMFALD